MTQISSPIANASGHSRTLDVEHLGMMCREIGFWALPYGLAIIFLWFGCMKFTAYEAEGITPFIANSPLVSWWHKLLGVQGTSNMLGVIEVTAGLLLLTRAFAPKLSAIGFALGARAA